MNPSKKLVIQWEDFNFNATKILKSLRSESDFYDVSLGCSDSNGKTIEAHKVMLASFSSVFRSMLKQNNSKQVTNNSALFLRGVQHQHLSSLMDFIYEGEVHIDESEFGTFLSVAEDLKIDGLSRDSLFEDKAKNEQMESIGYLDVSDKVDVKPIIQATYSDKKKVKKLTRKRSLDIKEENEAANLKSTPSLNKENFPDNDSSDSKTTLCKKIGDRRRVSDFNPGLTKRASLPNPTITDINGESLTLEESKFGGFNLIYDEHAYHITGCGSKTLGWECKKRKVLNCKATLSTDIEVMKLLRKSHDHNHAPIEN